MASTGTNWSSMLTNLGNLGAGLYGSQNATQQQQQGINAGIGAETGAMNSISGYYNNIMPAVSSYWNPSLTTGNNAMTTLDSALGTGGAAPNYQAFYNMPGYNWAVQQGTQAINRAAAAQGSAYTPNTMDAVGQYVTGTAMQDYNTYINQLLNTAGYGQTAANALTNARMGVAQGLTGAQLNTAGNIAGLDVGDGTAGSNGYMNALSSLYGTNALGSILGSPGVSSAIGSGIGNLASGVGNALSSLFGGNSNANASGVGTPSSSGGSSALDNMTNSAGLNWLASNNFNSSGVASPGGGSSSFGYQSPSALDSSLMNNMTNSAGLGYLNNSGF